MTDKSRHGGELLFYFPTRYEDRRTPVKLADLRPTEAGEKSVAIARVVAVEKRRTSKKNFTLTSALLADDSGALLTAVWFNLPWIEKVLRPGTLVSLYGRVEMRGGLQITSPEFEVLEDESDADLAIVPIYPLTAGKSQKTVRRAIKAALETELPKIEDFIPQKMRLVPDLQSAVRELHAPTSREAWLVARNRLAFDELFLLQTGLALRRKKVGAQFAAPLTRGKFFSAFISSLPFKLTNAQKKVLTEILADLKKTHPMNRLLQGDVGSGKTAVALAALLVAVDSGKQGVLMVPTEILAQQHYSRITKFLPNVRIAYLSGSQSLSERKKILASLKSGDAQIAVGTHALFSANVEFKDLGLVIVDEQHRFGVLQKQSLISKAVRPHVLVMTATPIPRTLTLTVYGDLAVSVIDELPPGRKPVETRAVPRGRIKDVLRFVLKCAREGRQVYWVCPLVEESETLDFASVLKRYEELKKCLRLPTALVHGQMSGDEKNDVMRAFERGETVLLVATSVIEVGVDVPNASLMVIDGADRFGLSQLHQLRGRIGRGDKGGVCILIANPKTSEARERIAAMVETNDGFRISEIDLKLRGPGEVCGVRQHGVTDFRVANLLRDREILQRARECAEKIVESDENLANEPVLLEAVLSRLGEVLDIAKTA